MRQLFFKLLNRKSQSPFAALMIGLTHTRSAWKRYGYAVLSIVLALIISLTFRDIFDPNPFLLFWGAVTFSAWYGGLRPGLLSVILSVVVINYFFVSPYTFNVSTIGMIRLLIFAITAATFSILHYRDILLLQEQGVFQITLSSIGDGVIVTDTQSRVVFLNEKAEALTGWTHDEANGRPLLDVFKIFNEETRQPVENPVAEVLRYNRVTGLANHTILRTFDGTEIPIADSGSPIRTLAGRVVGAVLVFRDVSQERQTAKALRDSENRFRNVADTAPVMIWMSNTDKLCNYFNQPWLDFTGRTLDQELGNGWSEGVHPSDYDYCLGVYTSSFDKRESFTMEYRLRRHDGVYRWVLDSGIPRFDMDGNFTGYIGSCIDLTERKRSETLLMSLHEITAALSSAATLEDVAEVIVTKALTVIGGAIGVVAMLSEDGKQVNFIRTQGAPEEVSEAFRILDIDSKFPIVDAIREQKTIWLETVEAYLEAYPQMKRVQDITGTQAVICLPLTINKKTFGALGITFNRPVELTQTDRGFMMALAQQCAQTMERAQLSEQAKAGAAIEERQRLARELHDAISQTLYAITITAETLPRLWEHHPEEVPQHLERLLLLGRGAHAEMRVMLLELRPDQLPGGSIREQFQQLATMLLGRKNINVLLEISPDIEEPSLPPAVHIALYRISQEALNNIIKHSTATQVEVRLMKKRDVIKLLIQDNGRGFDLSDITPHLGMSTMRERAESIGARFDISSLPQQGTRIMVEWSLQG